MNKRFLKFLPIAAALLITASCSRDDDGNAPASGRDGVHTVSTTTDNPNIVSIPFSITVGGKPSSLTKAQVVEEGTKLTQKFSEDDILIITGEGLDKDNPSILTISSDGIDKDEATFTGNLYLADGASESDLSQLKAELANKTLENEGKLLGEPVLVSNLQEAFEKYGYLVADFTYDAGATQINLEQHTAFLVFDLPYTGAKVNVKIGEETTPVFVSSNQVLAVPDGATVTSKLLTEDLAINLKPNNPGDKVDVVFDIKRDDLPDDCIPGLFSVSDDKQVFFSKGNLQYNATPQEGGNQWRFAPTQYSICHKASDDVGDSYSKWNNKWTDLFGWGTWLNGTDIEEPYETQTDDATSYVWSGTSAIGSEWETLTCGDDQNPGEWNYLLGLNGCTARDNADKLNHWATVNSVPGLVILPDGYGADKTDEQWKTFWEGNINWTDLEKAGAVFLPASGGRVGTGVGGVGDYGGYWSSLPCPGDPDGAFYLVFGDGRVVCDGYGRCLGQSVRLVRRL